MKILTIVFAVLWLSACASNQELTHSKTRPAKNVENGLTLHEDKLHEVFKAFPHANDSPSKVQVKFAFVIEPDGSVSRAKIINKQVNSMALRKQLLATLNTFEFGSLNVKPADVKYTVDFNSEKVE
ncbi:hypothetical protein [Aliiglaciecola sp. M165]|uniref:hypothetical protein n=1 Tax=Aliiglaciecola sp. M165 TaxID=2593649 RepID=UPI0011810186|nr:hypothetical protein [Aliiglaciecola sp. M165]TRY29321.1 hypothetical protein FM019_18115 [Aliiglaciecola sp. M165]